MATAPNRSTSTARQNHRRPNRKQGLPLRNRRKLSEQPGPSHTSCAKSTKPNKHCLYRHFGDATLVGDTSMESESVLFPDTMIRIRLNAAICDARFFVLIWNSRIMRDQIESTARTTAGIHKISQTDIERFEIPLPSLK